MWSLLGCCLFGFLLATGTCLECELCSGAGKNCTGVMKTCTAEEDTCIISVKQIYKFPVTGLYVSKDCGRYSECRVGIREMDFGNRVGVRMNRVCCTGDACRTVSPPELPPPDTKPNGFQCPGCLGMFSTECDETPVACTGTSTQCVELAGQISFYAMTMDLSMKGCVNDEICHYIRPGVFSFGGASVDLSLANCTAASNASYVSL